MGADYTEGVMERNLYFNAKSMCMQSYSVGNPNPMERYLGLSLLMPRLQENLYSKGRTDVRVDAGNSLKSPAYTIFDPKILQQLTGGYS